MEELQRKNFTLKDTSNKIKEILTDIVQRTENDTSLEILDVHFATGSKAGDNYLSNIQRAFVYGRKGNSKGYSKTFIVKTSLSKGDHFTFFDYAKLWYNEIQVYECILPLLEEAGGKNLRYPKLFFADSDHIILEDLKADGYVMADRRTGIDLQHSKIALRALAEFHSASLILRRNNARAFEFLKYKLTNHPYQENESLKGSTGLVENAIRTAVNILKSQDGGDIKYIRFINYVIQIGENVFEILKELVEKKISEYTVVAHGDFYLNNFLFSYSGNEVDNIMLIDYQGTRIMDLTFDLHHVIYTSVQPEIRREYMDTLLKYYHGCLCSHLEESTIFEDSYFRSVLSYERLKYEFEQNRVFGLISAVTMLPAMTYNPDNVPEMSMVTKAWENNNDEQNMDQFYTKDLTERLQDLAEEFIERNWCET